MRFSMLLVLVLVVGCSTSGTAVFVGGNGPFEPTIASEIPLLLEEPDRSFIVFALVEGTAATDDYFTKVRTEAAAVEALKLEAARIGAHAILLGPKQSKPYGDPTYGFEKFVYTGKAIRYIDEPDA